MDVRRVVWIGVLGLILVQDAFAVTGIWVCSFSLIILKATVTTGG